MKKCIIAAVLVICASLVFPAKLGVLPEVLKPTMISIDGDELYVAQGAEVSVYSMGDMKLLRTFGKKGEGPGELMEIPNFPNKVTVYKGKVFVTGIGKAVSFSKKGEFLKEFKTDQQVIQMFPVGENFVAKRQTFIDEGRKQIMKILLYGPDMKVIKELYRQDWVKQGNPPKMVMNMELDFTSFTVADEKIFIEKSPQGYLIDVYDHNGKHLYSIKKDDPKMEFTSEDKTRAVDFLKNDPAVKNDLKQIGGWEGFKKMLDMRFPDYFPPIKGIDVSGDNIYVRTYKKKNGKDQYQVLDLKGNLLRTVYISDALEPSVFAQIAGARLYYTSAGNMYYLLENDENEEWELHMEPLK